MRECADSRVGYAASKGWLVRHVGEISNYRWRPLATIIFLAHASLYHILYNNKQRDMNVWYLRSHN